MHARKISSSQQIGNDELILEVEENNEFFERHDPAVALILVLGVKLNHTIFSHNEEPPHVAASIVLKVDFLQSRIDDVQDSALLLVFFVLKMMQKRLTTN